ncbi:MAG: hypothetical protein ABSB71_07985 [Candidatus Bathyarchaeia archaeon]|jgi:hypothetical protein
MYKNNKGLVTPLLVLIAICIVVIIIPIFIAISISNNISTVTEAKLKADGFKIATGNLNSPAIMQTTHDYSEFVQIAHNINATVVYKVTYNPSYAVIANDTYGCEYYP